jgi:hypothetical protein
VLDLASLAAMNDYDAQARRKLLEAYGADGGVGIAEPELERIVRLVRLMGFFWARLGEVRTGGALAYKELAAEIGASLR